MGAVPTGAPATAVPSCFVHDGFVASAPWYDPLTRVFSFGLDARWRRTGLECCALLPGQRVLDVATGTGELGIAARRALGARGIVVGLDFCRPMLEEAQRKLALVNEGPVTWIQGRAEALPFRVAAFDCVTLGFALRHVEDLDAALREIRRMLRPGGRFVLVEWTRPKAAIPRWLFLGYMRWIVPPLVRLASRNRRVGELAAYLPRSIASFMSGEALSCRLEAAGFEVIETRSCMLGLVSICVGLNMGAGAEGRQQSGHGPERAIARPCERGDMS